MMSVENTNLSDHEIAVLSSIMRKQGHPRSAVAKYHIDDDLTASNFTLLASALALTHLVKKEMVEYISNSNPQENDGYLLTDKGESWLLENEDKLVLMVS